VLLVPYNHIETFSILIEEMPQVEARVIMVQDAGKQEELLKALKVRSWGL
jgi:hypothetical protein